MDNREGTTKDFSNSQMLEEYKQTIEKLKYENQELKKRKNFGLVYEHAPDEQAKRLLNEIPVLKEDVDRAVVNSADDVNHLLINGDNFHALTAMRATHASKVDVIYIDPPYNTGNKDFIYNDNYLDKEDGYRHSKWLSFMEIRLKLAYELLSDAGVIFVSIDDNEQARLKLLMDEVFGGENFIANICWRRTDNQANIGKIATVKEYVILYSKDKTKANMGKLPLSDKAKLEYRYSDSKGLFRRSILLDKTRGRHYYEVETPSGKILNGPWMKPKEAFVAMLDLEKVYWASNGKMEQPYGKIYLNESTGQIPSDLWGTEFGTNQRASNEIESIFGTRAFDFSKPKSLIKSLIAIGSSKKDATILDFFAGSGTTAHAVVELNKEDGGRRQCILVTDGGKAEETGESSKNANKETVHIAEEITYERVRRVLTGKDWADCKDHEAMGGNLHYFKVEMLPIPTDATYSDKASLLRSHMSGSAEIESNIFDLIQDIDKLNEETFQNTTYKVFKLGNEYLVVVEGHDDELTELNKWFESLSIDGANDANVRFYGENLSRFTWMGTPSDILPRMIGSHSYSKNLLRKN